MSGVELAACPFDGCAAEVRLAMDEFRRARHVVVCRGCGAKSDSSIGEQAAIAAWNRRAVPMEAVAWRLRRVGVEQWNLWDLDPRIDNPAYANADTWEVQALALIPQAEET